MRHITESGFGFACNSLIVLFAAATLLCAPQARSANSAPVISGSPAKTAVVGTKYWFQTIATDANSDPLTFKISNKPVWAIFGSKTGALYGIPTSAQVGTYGNIIISVTDGVATKSLPAFSITVKSSTASNTAPKISGTPLTSIAVGASYSFKPTASDANGDTLSFSIANKPAWATFSTTTGQLAGIPSAAHVGTTSNIWIKVTDGKLASALPTFSIAVTQIATGSATLSWTPPTANTNGTALTNLAGYRIKYGKGSTSLTQTVQISNIGVTRYVIDNLGSGTWYFGVVAYTSAGIESTLSKLASKTIK